MTDTDTKRPKGVLVRLGDSAPLLDHVGNTNAYIVALMRRANTEWRAAYGRLREAGWASSWVRELCEALGPMPDGLGVDDIRHHLELVSVDGMSDEVRRLHRDLVAAMVPSWHEPDRWPNGRVGDGDPELADLYVVVRHYHSHDHAVRELVGA